MSYLSNNLLSYRSRSFFFCSRPLRHEKNRFSGPGPLLVDDGIEVDVRAAAQYPDYPNFCRRCKSAEKNMVAAEFSHLISHRIHKVTVSPS